MDPKDQVAIHEAMEQQTISITKAGIQATLNARTSILAAANPIFGRYDRTKTLRQNVQISAPIMSRFDLFFIVLDEADPVVDEAIATHVVSVHQKRHEALAATAEYSMSRLQGYVRYARTFKPVMTTEAQELIIKSYISLRAADSSGTARAAYRITVRQLEALVRLSEAIARLHLDALVRTRYVLEAHALLKKSLVHVDAGADVALAGGADEDDEVTAGDRRPAGWSNLSPEERERLAQLQAAAGADDAPEGEGGGGGGGGGGGARYTPSFFGSTSADAKRVIAVTAASYAGAAGVAYDAAVIDTSPALLPHPPAYYAALKATTMTVCRLPARPNGAARLHRRLDIKSYPHAALPFALLYFTGSDYFNRSLRAYVAKLNWSLSDHGLTRVVRGDSSRRADGSFVGASKEHESHSVVCANEADVLRAIGVPWREPAERALEP